MTDIVEEVAGQFLYESPLKGPTIQQKVQVF